MKFVVFCLINIIFSSELSEWIDLNRDIVNSRSYKIFFHQKIESIIGESVHFNLDTNTNTIIFRDEIKYESSDRIIIANSDSLRLLNKKNKQLFIDYPDDGYSSLLAFNLIEALENSQFTEYENGNYYYVRFDDSTSFRVYFANKSMSIKIFNNNMNIELSNIYLSRIDSIEAKGHFDIDSSSIFDLRNK